jgi:hypothetical protein
MPGIRCLNSRLERRVSGDAIELSGGGTRSGWLS